MTRADLPLPVELALAAPTTSPTAWLAVVPVECAPGLLDTAHAWLHPAERAVLERFEFPRRRESFVLGRAAARRAANAMTGGLDPALLHVDAGVFGQPVVRGPWADAVEVSIAHTAVGAVAVAFTPGACLAVDVEHLRDDLADTVADSLTTTERALLSAAGDPGGEGRWHFWSLREALGKALRCGLTGPGGVLAIEQARSTLDGGWRACFANFPQYWGRSWRGARSVLAVVVPQQTVVTADLSRVLSLL